MKAIQFKKTGTFTGNDEEIQALFGGHFCYMGKGRLKDIEMYFERGSQSLPIKFNDWIIDLNGGHFSFRWCAVPSTCGGNSKR